MRKENGVTFTALVITIIITLILSGITINLTIGQDGIITKAQQAKIEMKKAEIKDTMKLDILTAETDAKIRGENLEKAQLNDIVAKYGELQEDEDTIITHEDKFEISLKEIWYGVLSDSGSYTDKVEQIEILESEIAELKTQYEELKTLNEGNEEILQELNRQITELEEKKKALEEQITTLTSQNESLSSDNENLTNEKTRLEEALVKLNEEYETFKKTEGTATQADILSGKTAWVNGSKITGTMVNRGALNANLNAGQSYTVLVGYTTGGTITANSLASQTQATATADNITEGKTAWVNGQLVTGNGKDNQNSYENGISNASYGSYSDKVTFGYSDYAARVSFNFPNLGWSTIRVWGDVQYIWINNTRYSNDVTVNISNYSIIGIDVQGLDNRGTSSINYSLN